MPLTKRKIRSIRKTRGRKTKRNYRNKRKLSRKGGRRKKKKNTKTKKRNRTGKGFLNLISKCFSRSQYHDGDTCLEDLTKQELTEEELVELNFSTNKLKENARIVKAKIKNWVEDFKAREGREPNNIEKKEIDHLYKKFRKIQKMWEKKLSPTRLDLHKFHNDLRKMNKEGLEIPIDSMESDVSTLTPSSSPGNNLSM